MTRVCLDIVLTVALMMAPSIAIVTKDIKVRTELASPCLQISIWKNSIGENSKSFHSKFFCYLVIIKTDIYKMQ